jgi:hypothetical protein
MKLNIPHLLVASLVGAAIMAPVALSPSVLRAQDRNPRRYHDNGHNDDHEWNAHEDRAYRMWAKENHRRYVTFDRIPEQDRQSYWGWRHEHSDALLKIEIR